MSADTQTTFLGMPPFPEAAVHALADEQLRANLHRATSTIRAKRADVIGELEQMDRGRYAGPVGWMDASGDGEWGIALRSGELDGKEVELDAVVTNTGHLAVPSSTISA